MSQESTVNHYTAASRLPLEEVLNLLDEVHSAASDDMTERMTGMSKTEAIGYLHDIIYTAQETLAEVQAAKATEQKQPVLRLVEKIHKAG